MSIFWFTVIADEYDNAIITYTHDNYSKALKSFNEYKLKSNENKIFLIRSDDVILDKRDNEDLIE